MLGGALGAAARAGLVWPFQADGGPFVVAVVTLGINVVGSGMLGVVVGALGTRHPSARAFLGTGILGGFTTYSAFAVQAATLAPAAPWFALLLALVSLLAGVAASGLGLHVGRRLGHRPGALDAPAAAE